VTAREEIGSEYRPNRAVIDIGSNTVRLVVYCGSERAPQTWLNEKVTAKLGRNVSSTGKMPDKAIRQALKALSRYAVLLADLGVSDVQTVATAAARDAENGAEFLEQVRALGLRPRLLSGEEEARGSAFGVIGAFPGAQGTVADLGGGSLELVMVDDGECHDGVSLPLGTLRLAGLRERGDAGFRKAIEKEMAKAGWAAAHPGPLYMVGGTWRALAAFAMKQADYPMADPHAFRLTPQEADALARDVAKMAPGGLSALPRLSASRAAVLPDAAAMLRVMLAELKPNGIVFSSWGLREGLLFQRLPAEARAADPLISSVAEFTGPRGGSALDAEMIADWTAEASEGDRRTRLAATMLALAARHIEPNLRARHAYEWALDKRWVGLEPEGRGQIAGALLGACGLTELPPQLERLAPPALLDQAVSWGLAIRLCRRLGAGSRDSLLASTLQRSPGRLLLTIEASRAPLLSDKVVGDLEALAARLDCKAQVEIASSPLPARRGFDTPVT
jgi:exopolyphosphatase / guanosine-5'-triphosphate,3'-diphosphate pyrophosphatase